MERKKILLGVTGGIACYKAADLASLLTKHGYSVSTVLTEHAEQFVTPVTFRAVTQNPVYDALFGDTTRPVPHVSLGEDVDLCIIAPATANVIGKIAGGIADDLLTTTIMACPAPKIIVPSMNTNMWENPLVQANVSRLKNIGYYFVEPEYGHLACGAEGKGRYPQNEGIIGLAEELLALRGCLKGRKIIITGGGTRERLDPVRVLANLSSGKMGLALRNAALTAGAEVKYIQAETADQLKKEISEDYESAEILIMAAAVSDYRPLKPAQQKIKSTENKLTIELEKTEDLLAYFGRKKQGQYLVGFALETENLEENAKKKLKNKNLDLIVANDPDALGSDSSTVRIIGKDGISEVYQNSKQVIAEKIIERICRDISRA